MIHWNMFVLVLFLGVTGGIFAGRCLDLPILLTLVIFICTSAGLYYFWGEHTLLFSFGPDSVWIWIFGIALYGILGLSIGFLYNHPDDISSILAAGATYIGRVETVSNTGAGVMVTKAGHAYLLYGASYAGRLPLQYTMACIKITKLVAFGKYQASGIFVSCPVKDPETNWYYRLLAWGNSVKLSLVKRCMGWYGSDIGGLYIGITLGGSSSETLATLMKDLGILQIVAVSGINIQYLLQLISLIVRKWPERWQRMGKLGIALLLFAFVGEAVSLVRVLVTQGLELIESMSGLLLSGLTKLFLTVIIMLLVNRTYLFDAGYWLTMSACFGVYCAYPFIKKRICWKNVLFDEVLLGEIVWLCVLPMQLFFFGKTVLWGSLVGVALSPLLEVATVVGYITLPFIAVPGFGELVSRPTALVLSIMLFLVNMFHGSL